jgi:hypothetical protein
MATVKPDSMPQIPENRRFVNRRAVRRIKAIRSLSMRARAPKVREEEQVLGKGRF